jgi:predicted regulator of Ras-like GTPase activity (Roadblock/LC7/MglB family)
MTDINVVANYSEVLAAVLSDPSGALLDAYGDVDGEAAGAVHSYCVQALTQAGEILGLGAFQRSSVTGPSAACVIMLNREEVLGVYVDPSKPLGAVEKKLQDTLQK